MNHYPAIRCIEKRITELNDERLICKKIMENPEMLSDYYFAKSDLDNINNEISNLKETIKYLIE